MVEDKNSKDKSWTDDHSCMTCHGWGGMCHHHPWMVVVRVVILFAIFWLGMQLGEVKAYLHDGYRMGGYDGYYMMDAGYPDVYGPGMMRSYNAQYDTAQPTTGATGKAAVPTSVNQQQLP